MAKKLSIRLFLHQTQASAMIEFSLVLPLLMGLFWFTLEASRFIIVNQKLVKATSTMADMITQGDTLCENGEFASGFFSAGKEVLKPFAVDDSTYGVVYTSAASTGSGSVAYLPAPCNDNPLNSTCIMWQENQGMQRPNGAPSVGNVDEEATLPNGSTISDRQNVFIVETFYAYQPMLETTAVFAPFMAARNIYNAAVFKPRAGNLLQGCS